MEISAESFECNFFILGEIEMSIVSSDIQKRYGE